MIDFFDPEAIVLGVLTLLVIACVIITFMPHKKSNKELTYEEWCVETNKLHISRTGMALPDSFRILSCTYYDEGLTPQEVIEEILGEDE